MHFVMNSRVEGWGCVERFGQFKVAAFTAQIWGSLRMILALGEFLIVFIDHKQHLISKFLMRAVRVNLPNTLTCLL